MREFDRFLFCNAEEEGEERRERERHRLAMEEGGQARRWVLDKDDVKRHERIGA